MSPSVRQFVVDTDLSVLQHCWRVRLQSVESSDGWKEADSVLSPRTDISLETGADKTPVKHKKGHFQDLSVGKSDRQSVGQRNSIADDVEVLTAHQAGKAA